MQSVRNDERSRGISSREPCARCERIFASCRRRGRRTVAAVLEHTHQRTGGERRGGADGHVRVPRRDTRATADRVGLPLVSRLRPAAAPLGRLDHPLLGCDINAHLRLLPRHPRRREPAARRTSLCLRAQPQLIPRHPHPHRLHSASDEVHRRGGHPQHPIHWLADAAGGTHRTREGVASLSSGDVQEVARVARGRQLAHRLSRGWALGQRQAQGLPRRTLQDGLQVWGTYRAHQHLWPPTLVSEGLASTRCGAQGRACRRAPAH
mmetsp:Transcript_24798/g.53490  ORF Transcript_24798/g.53490 Transcript_24798/m.53490 type:complete len:265 (+) Transcript_24798:182-976(+)